MFKVGDIVLYMASRINYADDIGLVLECDEDSVTISWPNDQGTWKYILNSIDCIDVLAKCKQLSKLEQVIVGVYYV